jgi:mRNA-degrading endonuclease toxin of MazEF toxin-antitoxin module
VVKNFNKWNKLKKEINYTLRETEIKSGEIWLCNLGVNVGYEINGKNYNFSRPTLILKAYGEYGSAGAISIPLTSKFKNKYFNLKIQENSYTNLTQIRFLDLKRFERRLGKISSKKLETIRKGLIKVL